MDKGGFEKPEWRVAPLRQACAPTVEEEIQLRWGNWGFFFELATQTPVRMYCCPEEQPCRVAKASLCTSTNTNMNTREYEGYKTPCHRQEQTFTDRVWDGLHHLV